MYKNPELALNRLKYISAVLFLLFIIISVLTGNWKFMAAAAWSIVIVSMASYGSKKANGKTVPRIVKGLPEYPGKPLSYSIVDRFAFAAFCAGPVSICLIIDMGAAPLYLRNLLFQSQDLLLHKEDLLFHFQNFSHSCMFSRWMSHGWQTPLLFGSCHPL
jgi:hypothetical protein